MLRERVMGLLPSAHGAQFTLAQIENDLNVTAIKRFSRRLGVTPETKPKERKEALTIIIEEVLDTPMYRSGVQILLSAAVCFIVSPNTFIVALLLCLNKRRSSMNLRFVQGLG